MGDPVPVEVLLAAAGPPPRYRVRFSLDPGATFVEAAGDFADRGEALEAAIAAVEVG